MPWTRQETKWVDRTEDAREHPPFSERGKKLIDLWGEHCLANFELNLHVGYAIDPDSKKRMGAIIGVSFNDKPAVDFNVEELRLMIRFFQSHSDNFIAGDGTPQSMIEDYKQDLKGFIDSLEYGIIQAEQFEPNNIN